MRIGRTLGVVLAVLDVLALAMGAISLSTTALVAAAVHVAACLLLAGASRRYLREELPNHRLARRSLLVFCLVSSLCAAALSAAQRMHGGQDFAFSVVFATTALAFVLRPVSTIALCVWSLSIEACALVSVDGVVMSIPVGLFAMGLSAVVVSLARFALIASYEDQADQLWLMLERRKRLDVVPVIEAGVQLSDGAVAQAEGAAQADAAAVPQAEGAAQVADQAEGAAQTDPYLGPGQISFDFESQDQGQDVDAQTPADGTDGSEEAPDA